MERNLLDALQTKDSFTENGMITNSTSLNACVDMFSRIGSMRNEDYNSIINLFVKALEEDALTAMKLLFWARDIRGGAGERKSPRYVFQYLAENRPAILKKNLQLIAEFGRWDDLFSLIGTPVESDVLNLIAKGLEDKNGLLAKWLPRPNSKNKVKKLQYKAVMKKLGLKPKEYRKLLSSLSNTVEQLMCANKWSDINYGQVPSKAMSDYMKAFGKHDHTGFTTYLDSVQKGDAKINAGAVYPYDILKSLIQGNNKGADVQWNALPNFLEGNNEIMIPVVDVSGSMFFDTAKISGDLYAGHVALSLGLYISERNTGIFKDATITFSDAPKLDVLKGTLSDRYRQLNSQNWGGSTNLQGVYKLLLDTAVNHNVPQDGMPTMIIILSDMEFNQGTSGHQNNTAQEMLERMYEQAGYKVPKIVYWNLAGRNDKNKPVQFDKSGTAMVSGFSPSLLKSLLSGKNITPYDIMMDTIGSSRYSEVSI